MPGRRGHRRDVQPVGCAWHCRFPARHLHAAAHDGRRGCAAAAAPHHAPPAAHRRVRTRHGHAAGTDAVDAATEADQQVAAARGVATAEERLYFVLRLGDGATAGGDEHVAASRLVTFVGGDRCELPMVLTLVAATRRHYRHIIQPDDASLARAEAQAHPFLQSRVCHQLAPPPRASLDRCQL